jgi:hypothetical protein
MYSHAYQTITYVVVIARETIKHVEVCSPGPSLHDQLHDCANYAFARIRAHHNIDSVNFRMTPNDASKNRAFLNSIALTFIISRDGSRDCEHTRACACDSRTNREINREYSCIWHWRNAKSRDIIKSIYALHAMTPRSFASTCRDAREACADSRTHIGKHD